MPELEEIVWARKIPSQQANKVGSCAHCKSETAQLEQVTGSAFLCCNECGHSVTHAPGSEPNKSGLDALFSFEDLEGHKQAAPRQICPLPKFGTAKTKLGEQEKKEKRQLEQMTTLIEKATHDFPHLYDKARVLALCRRHFHVRNIKQKISVLVAACFYIETKHNIHATMSNFKKVCANLSLKPRQATSFID